MSKFYNKLAVACMLLGCSAIGHADDAEIFFNKELQHVNPNVIFLLDTSGSMNYAPSSSAGSSSGNLPSRMDSLKDALTAILTNDEITDIRVGVISFASYLNFIQDLEEIDGLNGENSSRITVTTNGTRSTITQKIINGSNGYASTGSNNRMSLPPANVGKTVSKISDTGSGYFAYRFNDILLKQSSTVGDLSATLRIYSGNYGNKSITLYMDSAILPDYLTTTPGFLYQKILGSTTFKTCTKPSGNYYECDVSDWIKSKISDPTWKDGNAISFYVNSNNDKLYIANGNNNTTEPQLIIEADSSLVAENKSTYREQILEKALTLNASGGTNTVIALQTMSNYISGIAKTKTQGPYHDTQSQLGMQIPSPIEEGCQLTHVIMMTDGQPQANWNGNIDSSYRYNTQAAQYMGYANYGSCRVITSMDADNKPITEKEVYNKITTPGHGAPNSEACGRAIASWMANIDQTQNVNGANYIRTHTIGFALANNAQATNFLEDIAHYGQGTSKAAENTDELVQAFKDIITDVRATDSPSASGRVTMSNQSSYKQRNEVFYALYASSAYNYWSGNMKGFLLKYIDANQKGSPEAERPILVGKDGATKAMGTDGIIISTVSSFWANSNADGGSVDKGGVRGMLTIDNRPQFTYRSTSSVSKTLFDELTTTDLGLSGTNAEARKKGLLEFIKGYSYTEGGGSEAPKEGTVLKIADSARSGVTLATYSCATAGISTKLEDCTTLSQVALLASNDGFIRGYDTASGTVLYEYMPKEMLPLISKLERKSIVNYDKPRFYGVDGNIVIYHNDINENDYMDDGVGTAYAYAVAGRGGSYIYALDISDKSEPKLKWQITGGDSGFDRLGYTWSVPVVGNIKQGGKVVPVLVFGGGYDKKPTDEDPFKTRTSDKGNAVYIVNAETGALIQAITEGMSYSVPSSVALVTDETKDKLITDIVFGDTGGQVWRFSLSNVGQNSTLSGGVIAKLGSGGSDSRKFFQKPAIYEYSAGGQTILSINIGSGFRNHPLSTDINDKIYSLRVPKSGSLSQPLTESDLAVSNVDYQSNMDELTGSLSNGFMINLQTNGEKVITDGLAEFGKLVFNTYVPVPTDKVTCKPRVGLQRTYVYDLMTGKSLLQNAYMESNVSAFPADVTRYCKGNYCTIVPSTDILSDKELPAGKDGADSPLIGDISSKGNPSNFIKMGWTDLFDISPN